MDFKSASLKEIKNDLVGINSKLNYTYQPIQLTGLYQFNGLVIIRATINEIESLGLFEETITSLKQSSIFTSSSDAMQIQPGESIKIINQLDSLQILVHNFLAVLLKALPEEREDSINIKLPVVNDFDELSKASRDIHVALTQLIINDEINGQTKIESVENGSIWLNVIVGSTAVTLIASLVWSSAVIYKKIQEGRLLEQQIKSLKVKNESLEDILKAQKADTELMINAEAEHIQSEHFKENAPENIERIKNSITILANLISKGAEIHPSFIASESVSNLFPKPLSMVNIESKIKKLTSSSDN